MMAQLDEVLVSGLLLMLVGMVVVFGSLIVLLGLIQLIRLVMDRPVKVDTVVKEHAPASVETPDALSPELVAVLTAAAVAVLGEEACVRGVRLVERRDRAWALQGRRSIMTSHRPQR